MLEVNPNYIVCGCMVVNSENTPLYCNQNTGEVAYENSDDGTTMLVGEISITDPLEMEVLNSIGEKLMKNEVAGAKGLIFTHSGKVYAIMDDYTAEVRSLATIFSHSSETIQIDLDQEHDMDDGY